MHLSLARNPRACSRCRHPCRTLRELFERVQLERVYPDSKSFVDALPVRAPQEILADYEASASAPISICDASSRRISRRRRATAPSITPFRDRTCASTSIALWSVLERKPDDQRPVHVAHRAAGALHRAGRALQRDLLLGLVLHDARAGGKRPARSDRTRCCDNFAWLIDRVRPHSRTATALTT